MSAKKDFKFHVVAEPEPGLTRPITREEFADFTSRIKGDMQPDAWFHYNEGEIDGGLDCKSWWNVCEDLGILSGVFPEFFIEVTVYPELGGGTPWILYVKDGESETTPATVAFPPCTLENTMQGGKT